MFIIIILLPKCTIIWSNILPRLYWYGGQKPIAGEKTRKLEIPFGTQWRRDLLSLCKFMASDWYANFGWMSFCNAMMHGNARWDVHTGLYEVKVSFAVHYATQFGCFQKQNKKCNFQNLSCILQCFIVRIRTRRVVFCTRILYTHFTLLLYFSCAIFYFAIFLDLGALRLRACSIAIWGRIGIFREFFPIGFFYLCFSPISRSISKFGMHP